MMEILCFGLHRHSTKTSTESVGLQGRGWVLLGTLSGGHKQKLLTLLIGNKINKDVFKLVALVIGLVAFYRL